MKRVLGKKYGVTLLELMIVMAIIGVLSVVLFRTFNSVSELSFRIQQQKNVGTEIITLSQIIQNYSDRNEIDYSKYENLTEQKGITDILYLSGLDGKLALYTSGDCVDNGTTPLSGVQNQSCVFYVEKDGNGFSVTNPAKIYLSEVVFKIIPFTSEENYLKNRELCEQENLINCINAPGFWMMVDAYNARYTPGQWGSTIKVPVQEFFNLK